MNIFTATPSLHLFGAYSFFQIHIQHNHHGTHSFSPVLHKLSKHQVCPCCLPILEFSYALIYSSLVKSLPNPSEPLYFLPDASTLASAHALIGRGGDVTVRAPTPPTPQKYNDPKLKKKSIRIPRDMTAARPTLLPLTQPSTHPPTCLATHPPTLVLTHPPTHPPA